MRTSCTTDDQRPSSPTATGAAKTTTPRRRKSTRKMNNAENHAAVEIKRKAAKEDARYDLVERGESAKRNFEKIDKPHDENEEKQRTADSLTSLPPEDLRNVGVLALLCMILFN
jgi:seryl-tRNA synthetase